MVDVPHQVSQSDLGSLEGAGLEVFYSTSLEVRDTRFHLPDSGKEMLVLNHVDNFLVSVGIFDGS